MIVLRMDDQRGHADLVQHIARAGIDRGHFVANAAMRRVTGINDSTMLETIARSSCVSRRRSAGVTSNRLSI